MKKQFLFLLQSNTLLLLYPPEASGGYFGLAFATPPPRVERFSARNGWESSGVVGFDLGPLLQGQTRIAKVKSAYNSLIIDPRSLQYETNSYEILG